MSSEQSQLVAIVGPESTGKTTLAKDLAKLHRGVWLPEYAREFLNDVDYTEDDVHLVAHEQLYREQDFVAAEPQFGVLDTDGVVLRVWFQEKYDHVPSYIRRHLKQQSPRRYLLTYPDLPWEFDPRRESRLDLSRLFEQYERVLTEMAFDYSIVKGQGNARLECAIHHLKSGGAINLSYDFADGKNLAK